MTKQAPEKKVSKKPIPSKRKQALEQALRQNLQRRKVKEKVDK